MTVFRLLMAASVALLVVYTVQVAAQFGWNFVPAYFDDLAGWDWTGQFVLDFSILLLLAALWIAWRNQFSAVGIVLAVLASSLGSMLVGGYVLYLTFRERGDMARVLVGDRAAGAR